MGPASPSLSVCTSLVLPEMFILHKHKVLRSTDQLHSVTLLWLFLELGCTVTGGILARYHSQKQNVKLCCYWWEKEAPCFLPLLQGEFSPEDCYKISSMDLYRI